jgi:Sulfotransferase domain
VNLDVSMMNRQPPGCTFLDPLADVLARVRCRLFGDPEVPTLMHITHAKAGSTWINDLLKDLFRRRVAPRGIWVAAARGGDLSKHVFEPGRIYRAMFMTREKFLAHPELREIKRFIVIRDLRDTLVSLFFSLKFSHPVGSGVQTERHRVVLEELGTEEGLLHLLHRQLPGAAAMQASWINQGEILLRYEDLLENSFDLLRETFIGRLRLPVSEAALARAIRRRHFEKVFRRKLGVEDIHSHGRKGLPGDWKNHFTPEIRRQFAEKFGALLIETGYEKDLQWAC